ncbi:hypothetical protein A2875_05045 [Candidatus Gottesmanbacteria bacterium RIFCSPHIGHO2_01_FULL_46_14]|uniref:Glycosyltransferase RgtA/B/C/D-like domain-containing protein n=1 Tax=Candidatus Gottesmanbacteria bacterium RIFCSPHIGHO2_01_FULL_46_14 TaxID=1798380 RepID=A0A1F5ZQT4_9BACT|nr:MAG: hypothetical protein A2875_05045 [Candidatus Gottesmanbacteria bacterium RIFCSPHIGHO2_01_FULL_46_14]
MKNYKLFSRLGIALFIVFIVSVLTVSIRGIPGTPTSETVNESQWGDEGPFELSPERGRFALTLSLIENQSVEFTHSIVQFSTPDLGYKNGKFVSLFAPLLSFLIVPGYLLGRLFGYGQVGAYAIIALFALFNTLLIRSITIRMGANPVAASIGAALFLFGTPAFAYASSLYQHHVSLFLILVSLWLLVGNRSWLRLFFVWLAIGLGLPLDYPNIIMMMPLAIVAALETIKIVTSNDKIVVQIRLLAGLAVVGVVAPLVFFFWYNNAAYGSPLTLLSSLKQVKALNPDGTLIEDAQSDRAAGIVTSTAENRVATAFFQSRNFLRGFSILTVSRDRGLLYFAPVMLFGIVGVIILYKQKNPHVPLMVAILGANMVLYSMWGDPAGGWAFGGRYLIPTFAMLSIWIGAALSYLRRNIPFLIVFLFVSFYSIAVNTLGAISSNRNPPQSEILALEQASGKPELYSWDRNAQFVNAGKLKAFVYNDIGYKYMSSWDYYQYVTIFIAVILCFHFAFLYTRGNKKTHL